MFLLWLFWSPIHEGPLTLYSSLWTILILHLSIIWATTWVLVPSNTLSGFLWVVVAKAALFRGLLHINVAKKLTAGYSMQWQQLVLRYFLAPLLLVRSWCTSFSVEFPGKSLWVIGYTFDLCFVYPRRQFFSDHLFQPFHLHVTYRTLNLTPSLLFISPRTNQRPRPKPKAQYTILGP